MAMMSNRLKEYRYYLSSGVSTNISIKISLVELAPIIGHVSGDRSASGNTNGSTDGDGQTPAPKADSAPPGCGLEQLSGTSSDFRNSSVSEMFITAQIFSDGLPLHPMVIRCGRSCCLLCGEAGITDACAWLCTI